MHQVTCIQHKNISRAWQQRNSFDQSRVHRLLTEYAYLPMSEVETTLFRSLSGETFASDRTAIFEAAKAFENAQKKNRPVLLILGPHSNAAMADSNSHRSGTFGHQLKNYQVKRHVRKFSVVYVPKIQLAAFTNLKELTGWDKLDGEGISRQYGDTCLVVNPSGEIISKLDLYDSDNFVDQLKTALEDWKKK